MNRVGKGEGRVAIARRREGMSHENGGGEARHTRERGRMVIITWEGELEGDRARSKGRQGDE